ncbi:hypothetical protein [Holdemania massiliensis]|uniref:hypothetical protein n=1 Tax=Holdemania massiliensis TaxID=1468449 RepID=UPI001F05E120|nr:hypothetical protein [Holdemania massiliensis]MCH1942277.1 hypothetical protein [Holdemania massiliensis]
MVMKLFFRAIKKFIFGIFLVGLLLFLPAWYEKEATMQTWSVRTLQRNISSQYYYRMLQTQKQELVENEMKELTADYQNDKLEVIYQQLHYHRYQAKA